jgi:[pyruvate, water dikinase]-phosphate phosphotransferase / [pyruvate, water dikinase] kinase
MPHRTRVFFISDRTGLTVEALGNSLLTQFEDREYVRETVPFIDSVEAARTVVERINATASEYGQRPIVFSSLVADDVRAVIETAEALVLDVFERFIVPLEQEFGVPSSHAVGKAHAGASTSNYLARMEAINYTLAHDDGATHRALDEADIILVGVSRSGKTPTSLYLAMQFGIKAANYPLIPEDLGTLKLPPALMPLRQKVWGLSIAPERLAQIRSERRPDSKYASLANCKYEVDAAASLMRQHGIRFIDSTTKSIEEISTHILHETGLARRTF